MMKEEILVIIFMFCMSIILASYILCGWGRPNGHFTMKQLVVALILAISFILYMFLPTLQ